MRWIGKRDFHLIVLAALMPFSGCSRPASQYTVDYYVSHDEEREAKLRECANDPGALKDDALCINASKAGASKAIGSLRDRPAMTLLEAQELRGREQREKKAAQ